MKKDLEAAFARPYSESADFVHHSQAGMTLRDYFAAKAMQGLLSNPKLQAKILAEGGCASGWIESSAWAFADEMLKAREA